MMVRDLEDGGKAATFRIVTGIDNRDLYDDLNARSNENLGKDQASFDGGPAFRRTPIEDAAGLDTENNPTVGQYNPWYLLNTRHFKAIKCTGDWERESGPYFDFEQHNVPVWFVDWAFQVLCTNVRAGIAVLHNPL